MIDYTSMGERLSGEYRRIFEKAELYSDMNGIHDKVKADKMMNLLDLLMTAEADGKPVNAVIGSDVEKFCKDYFEDYDIRTQIRLIPEKLYSIALCLGFALLLSILFPDKPGTDLVHMQSDFLPLVGGILVGFVLAVLFKYLVGPLVFHSKKGSNMIYYVLVWVLFVAADVAMVFLIGDRNILVPVFPFLVGDVAYIAGYLIVRSVMRYRDTGSIRKPKLVDREFEFHLIDVNGNSYPSADTEIQKALVKRFQRINKRRSKKKKAAMTTQEFIAKVRREDAKAPYMVGGVGVFYIIIIGGIVVDDIQSFGIGWGTLLLLAIGLVIYVPLFLLVRYAVMLGAQRRATILDQWEKHGVVITEKK
ncbi:MAG: hypothetical protein Q4D32_07275 [Eubacteriales bacterium]|nr:hypothetical protein [Eubacteriales bacterium]